MERASELREVVGSLAHLRDEVGVLSITAGREAEPRGPGTPEWRLQLRHELEAVCRAPDAPRALVAQVAELAPHLDALFDPPSSGRGRGLYVAIKTGTCAEVAVQCALPVTARFQPVAHVLPLVAALEEGEPAGLISAGRDAIAVFHTELGLTRPLRGIELEPWIGDWWPEMKSAAAPNPLRGLHVVAQRERYQHRLAAAYRRTLAEGCGILTALAAEHGWSRAVVAGDARLRHVLEPLLHGRGMATIAIEPALEGVRRRGAVRRLEVALSALVGRERLARIDEALAKEAEGRGAVCGLAATVRALAERRVSWLLIDGTRTFPGIVAEGESLQVGDGSDVDLTDWLVAQALTSRSHVTSVSGAAAHALVGRGGIAALLRW